MPMNRKMTHTPEGVADILCDECELKFQIETIARNVFSSHGYRMVQPPSFEYYDVFRTATTSEENMFKMFDSDGRMLALRPDLTTSVARMAATKSFGEELPLRISYIGNAFRNDEAYSTVRQREFTQVGVELFGDNSVEADAEVIEIAIETIAKAGVQHFQIDIGQVEYFKGLANQAEFDEEDADKIRSFINEKDFIGLEKTLDSLCLDEELKEIFMHLPTMFGGIEVVEKALSYQKINAASKAALDNLMQVYRLLEEKGLSDLISIDLGMIPNLDYYTGIIVKGFTYGIGFPLCSGGRYNNLTGHFGHSMPATGIAIGVERVMAAIGDETDESAEEQQTDEYITVALAKGRLAELSVDIFEKIGFDVAEMKTKTRKLIFTDEKNKFRFILVKASDVPTYVEYGAADLGIVGKDTIMESGKNIYEVLDLGFGKCKMAVAGPVEMKDKMNGRNMMRVASKYTHIAKDYFHNVKGQTVDIIKLNGSVELGPLVGLSEVIVDIVESGKTLKENGLAVLEDICELSARLVVNKVSMKLHRETIVDIMEKIKGEI